MSSLVSHLNKKSTLGDGKWAELHLELPNAILNAYVLSSYHTLVWVRWSKSSPHLQNHHHVVLALATFFISLKYSHIVTGSGAVLGREDWISWHHAIGGKDLRQAQEWACCSTKSGRDCALRFMGSRIRRAICPSYCSMTQKILISHSID